MGRKAKDEAPNPNSIPNRDIIQRLNFLYQASSYLNGLGAAHAQAGPSNSATRSPKESSMRVKVKEDTNSKGDGEDAYDTRKRPGQRKATAHDLAQSYVKSMKIIGQKTTVKLDPTVKRTMCKGCNTLLMPGVTAKVRVKPLPSHGHAVSYTCMNCSFSRRIPAPPTTEQTIQASHDRANHSLQHMDIDPVEELLNTVKAGVSSGTMDHGKRVKQRNHMRKKKSIKPRLQPFFQRVEHIMFIGNERVERNLEDGGLH